MKKISKRKAISKLKKAGKKITPQAIASSIANTGNEGWRNRSKHGRDTLFAFPPLMWEAACEYFKWCDENPFVRSFLRSLFYCFSPVLL